MPKRDLDSLIADMDYPQDVADAVRNEVAKNGNQERILTGEMVLPARQDAIHWHDRLQGRFGLNDAQKTLERRVQELEAQLQHPSQEKVPWASEHSPTA